LLSAQQSLRRRAQTYRKNPVLAPKYFLRRNQDSCREFLKNYPHVALSEGLRQTLKNVVEIFKLVLTFR
jgi:hypothetical protein